MRTDLNFRDQVWNRPTAKYWVNDFILPIKHHAPNFNQRFWLGIREIPRSTTMKA